MSGIETIGQISPIPDGTLFWDCAHKLNAANLGPFFAHRPAFGAVARYLSRGGTEQPGDLTSEEVAAIHDAGLSLVLVQHVAAEGWEPSAELGEQYGLAAATHAAALGCPAGGTLWCDGEGMADGTSASYAVEYYQAWYAEVSRLGYDGGLYVGVGCGLTGDQLYYLLPFARYWHSGSRSAPVVSVRGFQAMQHIEPGLVLGDVSYDTDETMADLKGDVMTGWVK